MGGGKSTRYTSEQKREALELYERIESSVVVAERVGCSPGSVMNWVRKARKQEQPVTDQAKDINPLLLKLANGNDLTPFVGKDITQMMPREIWEFLRLINVKGEFKIEQTIHL